MLVSNSNLSAVKRCLIMMIVGLEVFVFTLEGNRQVVCMSSHWFIWIFPRASVFPDIYSDKCLVIFFFVVLKHLRSVYGFVDKIYKNIFQPKSGRTNMKQINQSHGVDLWPCSVTFPRHQVHVCLNELEVTSNLFEWIWVIELRVRGLQKLSVTNSWQSDKVVHLTLF